MKSSWTAAEDQVVADAVRRFGTASWTRIARVLQESGASHVARDGKRCRSRYLNHISPTVNKSAWTEAEERSIYIGHSQLGNRWSEIARRLKGRTDNAVKNHWYSLTRRAVRAALKAHRVDHIVSDEEAKRLASSAAVRGLRGLAVAEDREGRYEQMKEVCLEMLRKKALSVKQHAPAASDQPPPVKSVKRQRSSKPIDYSTPRLPADDDEGRVRTRRKIFSEEGIKVLAQISGAEVVEKNKQTAYYLLSLPSVMHQSGAPQPTRENAVVWS